MLTMLLLEILAFAVAWWLRGHMNTKFKIIVFGVLGILLLGTFLYWFGSSPTPSTLQLQPKAVSVGFLTTTEQMLLVIAALAMTIAGVWLRVASLTWFGGIGGILAVLANILQQFWQDLLVALSVVIMVPIELATRLYQSAMDDWYTAFMVILILTGIWGAFKSRRGRGSIYIARLWYVAMILGVLGVGAGYAFKSVAGEEGYDNTVSYMREVWFTPEAVKKWMPQPGESTGETRGHVDERVLPKKRVEVRPRAQVQQERIEPIAVRISPYSTAKVYNRGECFGDNRTALPGIFHRKQWDKIVYHSERPDTVTVYVWFFPRLAGKNCYTSHQVLKERGQIS